MYNILGKFTGLIVKSGVLVIAGINLHAFVVGLKYRMVTQTSLGNYVVLKANYYRMLVVCVLLSLWELFCMLPFNAIGTTSI